MTIIIGVAGCKQSGKSSLCEYIKHWYYQKFFDSNYQFKQYSDGIIEKLKDNNDYSINHIYCAKKMEELIKVYSFADALKYKVCMDILGLPYEQCWGTDNDKESYTPYLWDNLSLDIRMKYSDQEDYYFSQPQEYGDVIKHTFKVPRTGKMTAREVLKIVGTDIFRNQFDKNIWVNITIKMIKEENKQLALIGDVRFSSEVDAILNAGGYIIKLNRKISNDQHESETALNDYLFDDANSLTIDNQNMDIHVKNNLAVKWVENIVTSHMDTKIVYKLTWDEWKKALVEIAKEEWNNPYGDDPFVVCGEDAWRQYYDQGFSPNEAIMEDSSYWEPEERTSGQEDQI